MDCTRGYLFKNFQNFWLLQNNLGGKITLVNQTAIPASQYRYGIAATNDDDSVFSYGESIANFGAAYATNQESVKLQGTMSTSM
jgi:hypothetical protein